MDAAKELVEGLDITLISFFGDETPKATRALLGAANNINEIANDVAAYALKLFPMEELNPIHYRGRGPDHSNPNNINIDLTEDIKTMVDRTTHRDVLEFVADEYDMIVDFSPHKCYGAPPQAQLSDPKVMTRIQSLQDRILTLPSGKCEAVSGYYMDRQTIKLFYRVSSTVRAFRRRGIGDMSSGQFKVQRSTGENWLAIAHNHVPKPRYGTRSNDSKAINATALNFIGTTHCSLLGFVEDRGEICIACWMVQNFVLDEAKLIQMEAAVLEAYNAVMSSHITLERPYFLLQCVTQQEEDQAEFSEEKKLKEIVKKHSP